MSRRPPPARQVREHTTPYSVAAAVPVPPGDRAHVLRAGRLAGVLERTARGFRFSYDGDYLRDMGLPPVSLTLPRRAEPYDSPHLFACFAAVLAEGALAAEQCRRLRLDERDAFGRLRATAGGDVIGTLHVVPAP